MFLCILPALHPFPKSPYLIRTIVNGTNGLISPYTALKLPVTYQLPEWGFYPVFPLNFRSIDRKFVSVAVCLYLPRLTVCPIFVILYMDFTYSKIKR